MNWIYLHDLDPFALRITAEWGIRWYGLSYLAGFLLGYGLLIWQQRKGWLPVDRSRLADLVLTVALWSVAGGRVGYVLLYQFPYFLSHPLYLFEIWEGGMSIHGGIVGAIGALWYLAYRWDRRFFELADAAALSTPPGLMLGRIANFVNGELWGRPTGEGWGVKFPQEIYSWGTPRLNRLREILVDSGLISGDSTYLTRRQIIEVVNQLRAGNQRVIRAVSDLIPPRHPSQLYEALVEGPLLLGVLLLVRTRTSRPGVVSGAFMAGYGVVRFLVEFTRAPDPHIGYEFMGMTRGQEYSLLFVLAGAAMWAWARWNHEPETPQ